MLKTGADVDLVCRRIGLCVSPVRTSSFEILSRLMLALLGNGRESVGGASLAPLFDGFQECQAMLRDGVAAAFREIDAKLPDDLEAARVAALKATGEILHPLRSVANGTTAPSHDLFHGLAERIDRELRPAIGAFLAQLNAFAREEAARREADTRGLVAKTIDEVERITLAIKMISINASVEAAHAGEAGRGFAVIASEIRTLSSKSEVALDAIKVQHA